MNLRIERYVVATIVAYCCGPGIAYGYRTFFPVIMEHYSGSMTAMGFVNIGMSMLAAFPVSGVTAVWLFKAAKLERKNSWLWAVFAVFFHVVAVAMFYAVVAYQRSTRTDVRRP